MWISLQCVASACFLQMTCTSASVVCVMLLMLLFFTELKGNSNASYKIYVFYSVEWKCCWHENCICWIKISKSNKRNMTNSANQVLHTVTVGVKLCRKSNSEQNWKSTFVLRSVFLILRVSCCWFFVLFYFVLWITCCLNTHTVLDKFIGHNLSNSHSRRVCDCLITRDIS
jgi:hypothetical protein